MDQPEIPIRKRLKRREIPGNPRSVTFSCEKRLPLLRNPAIADLFAAALAAARQRHRFELYARVVMPEHVHPLLRSAPNAPLDRALLALKLSVARRVSGTRAAASTATAATSPSSPATSATPTAMHVQSRVSTPAQPSVQIQ